MYTLLIIITIIICLLLALVVLIQNPKGGGLDASFGGVSNNTFGAARTTDFLENATWGLAIALVVVSLLTAMAIGRGSTATKADDILNSATISTPVTDTATSITETTEEVITSPSDDAKVETIEE